MHQVDCGALVLAAPLAAGQPASLRTAQVGVSRGGHLGGWLCEWLLAAAAAAKMSKKRRVKFALGLFDRIGLQRREHAAICRKRRRVETAETDGIGGN